MPSAVAHFLMSAMAHFSVSIYGQNFGFDVGIYGNKMLDEVLLIFRRYQQWSKTFQNTPVRKLYRHSIYRSRCRRGKHALHHHNPFNLVDRKSRRMKKLIHQQPVAVNAIILCH